MAQLDDRQGKPFRILVEEGKCREFALATAPLAWRNDVQPPELSPVTFLASARFWMAAENSAWHGVERDYRRVLHGEQQFSFPSGPPPIGSELTGTERIERTYQKTGSRGNMAFSDTVTEFMPRRQQSVVASMRATSIVVEKPPPPTGQNPAPAPAPDGYELVREFTDDPLRISDFVRYQGASGDFNPIHHDDAFAKASGYPGPFAVGMLTAGVAATLATAHITSRDLRQFTARWKAQAWPGDALTYCLYERRTPDQRQLHVEVSRPTGQTHMQALASFTGAP